MEMSLHRKVGASTKDCQSIKCKPAGHSFRLQLNAVTAISLSFSIQLRAFYAPTSACDSYKYFHHARLLELNRIWEDCYIST